MINRRHIRIKVMQSVYALMLSENDKLDSQERFLLESIDGLHELYMLQLQLLVALHDVATTYNKASKVNYIQNDSALVNSPNFANNRVLTQIKKGVLLQEIVVEKNKANWQTHNELVSIIWKKIQKNDAFKNYMQLAEPDYFADKNIVLNLYKQIIAPNEKLADFFEDEMISWVDDIPFVNTSVLKMFSRLNQSKGFVGQSLYNDDDDKKFVGDLFKKVALTHNEFDNDIDSKTPNWDADRIADIDLILIKMALVEFVYFPSIPVRVTINEYIEIAKDYSTSKSGFFINGVLDKISKEYTKSGKSKKIGRGLL